MTTRWLEHRSPLGPMIVAARPEGVVGAWFVGQAHFAGAATDWCEDRTDRVLRATAEQLDEWFAGQRRQFALLLAPHGTAFQRAVWEAIARIGYGETQSYAALAASLGKPGAARAVGAASGRNPLSIVIPCHRLLGRQGALVGYAGGLERKQALLALEAAHARA